MIIAQCQTPLRLSWTHNLVRRRKPGDFIAVFRIFRAFIAGYTGGHPTHFPGRHFCRGEKLSGKNERVYEML